MESKIEIIGGPKFVNHVETVVRNIPALGLILALLSGVCLSTASLIVKLLKDIHPLQIVVVRSTGQLIVYFIIILIYRQPIFGTRRERIPLISRCLWGFSAMIFAYSAYHIISLADASTIIFSSPVYVSFFAWIFLGEPCGLFQFFMIIFSLIGVVLISKPTFLFNQAEPFDLHKLEGITYAFISSLSASLVFVSLRKIQKTPSPVVIFWFSITSMLTGSVLLVTFSAYTMPKASQLFLLFGICICGILGQLFLTLALKIEEAGPVSLARTIDIVMAFIYQVNILNEPVTWLSLFGAALIVSTVVISAVKKWQELKSKST